MANLADTAQMTMDLYYQQFRTDEDFLKLFHFQYLCGVAYSKLLEMEYKANRAEAKAEAGLTEIYLQDDWLIEQIVKMDKHPDIEGAFIGSLASPLFSFPNDPYSFGVQSVRKAGKTGCAHFIRTSLREAWMDCHLPTVTNKAFYYINNKKVIVTGARCQVEELVLNSVPEITDSSFGDNGGPVPKSKEDGIIRATLDLMMRARTGTVVDMSNNSNPNKALQTEVDNLFPNLRTKPL